MKNLNIEEIAKLEKCDCEAPCEACQKKYAHAFPEGYPSTANITGDLIATLVLNNNDHKSALAEDIAQIKKIIARIEEREKHTNQ